MHVVLDSHIFSKEHDSQLKKIENCVTPSMVNSDRRRNCASVDGKESKNSKVVVLGKGDAKAGGEEEETFLMEI